MSEAAARYASATVRKINRAIKNGSARLATKDANTAFSVMDLQLDRAGLIELHKLLRTFVVAARKLRVRRQAGLETVSVTLLLAPRI